MPSLLISAVINGYVLPLKISSGVLYNDNTQIYINDVECYWGPEQCDLMGGMPAHSRRLELDDL